MLRRIAVAGVALGVLLALPATVAADCNGPGCVEPDAALGGAQAVVLVAILVAFGAVMAIAELRRR